MRANHMWNKVKVDGKWYNLDLTSDDPTTEFIITCKSHIFSFER